LFAALRSFYLMGDLKERCAHLWTHVIHPTPLDLAQGGTDQSIGVGLLLVEYLSAKKILSSMQS
jgi:hypothetical protein